MNLDGLLLSKNTFLELKHDIQRIYLTLLSTTCVPHSPNSVCHFWNHTFCHVFHDTTRLHFFQFKHYILSTKSSPLASNFSGFLFFGFRPTKFLISFFKQKVRFSSKFHSLVSWEIILLYIFRWNFICFGKSSTSLNIHQIPHVVFWTNSVFLQTLHNSSILWDIILMYIFI